MWKIITVVYIAQCAKGFLRLNLNNIFQTNKNNYQKQNKTKIIIEKWVEVVYFEVKVN